MFSRTLFRLVGALVCTLIMCSAALAGGGGKCTSQPTADAGGPYQSCGTASVPLAGTATNQASVRWTTSGDGQFDDDASLTPTYTPSPGDISTGSITLTLRATSSDPDCTDDVDTATLTIDMPTNWYEDSDGDTYGNPDVSQSACEQPAGYVADNTDCNDTNPGVHPGADELCNEIDDDCDGQIDEDAVNQTTFYADKDMDGFGDPATATMACSAPPGHVPDGTDCDDTNPTVNPQAPEVECDGIDNNCNGNSDEDTSPPMIQCPPNAEVGCGDSTDPDQTGSATAIDNCDAEPAITHEDDTSGLSGCNGTGMIVRTWTATDAAGNSATCTQTITVTDTTDPIITCPADATVECGSPTDSGATGTAMCSDTCGGCQISSSDSFTLGCGNTGTLTRTWTATDACGNISSCTQTITVTDTTPPAFTSAPENVTFECDGQGNTQQIADWLAGAAASDGCGSATVTNDYKGLTDGCGATGSAEVTFTATDACGLTTTHKATVTVADTTPPQISCPKDATVECGSPTDSEATGSANCEDACGGCDISASDSFTATCGSAGTLTRTWTATDACGNSSSCTQTITVQDTTAPEITCPEDITIECGGSIDPEATGSATASDVCTTQPAISFEDDTEGLDGCGNTGTIVRTWTATDACGNSTSCDQVITIEDTTPPAFTNAPADVTFECDGRGNPAEIDAWLASAAASDACGEVSIAHDFESLSDGCGATGSATVTFTATDACGLTTTHTATVTVADTTPPAFTSCPERPLNIAVLNSTQFNGVTAALLLPAVINAGLLNTADACGDAPSVEIASPEDDFFALGVHDISFTATDSCGNVSAPCELTIIVVQAQAVTCWDTNGNGVADPAEDTNGDGQINVADCQGDIGPQGAPGPQGPAGQNVPPAEQPVGLPLSFLLPFPFNLCGLVGLLPMMATLAGLIGLRAGLARRRRR